MSMFPQDNTTRRPFELAQVSEQEKAIFHFFNAVYAWMCVGMAVTATVAWVVAQNAAMVRAFSSTGVAIVFLLGLVAMTWAIQSAAQRIQPTLATALFLLLSALIGAFLSGIFVVYHLQTIAAAFVMTAGVFGGMSIYGFVTKRDLTAMRSILIMCVMGLFLATIVNLFIANSFFFWILNYAILAVFIGLTAADTQRLKAIAQQVSGDARASASYAIVGSLQLYLDFINMFMAILNIMGGSRR
jgi:FtsH-binding integral membrane protein